MRNLLLGRWGREDGKFKACLGYRLSSSLAWETWWDCLKMKSQKKTRNGIQDQRICLACLRLWVQFPAWKPTKETQVKKTLNKAAGRDGAGWKPQHLEAGTAGFQSQGSEKLDFFFHVRWLACQGTVFHRSPTTHTHIVKHLWKSFNRPLLM